MRIALIIGIWIVALTGGVLLFTAKKHAESTAEATQDPPAATADTPEIVTHPAFSLPDLEGQSREFAEWDGKHRLVNFWATWCAPCRREIPLLKAFQDAQSDSNIQVIGVAVDFVEEVERYAVDAQFNYPVLVGQEDAMAIAETSGVPFIGLPFTMIVSADGELITTHTGEIFEDDLDKLVDTLGALDAGTITIDEARDRL